MMNPYDQVGTPANPYMDIRSTTDDNQKALKRLDIGAKKLAYGEDVSEVESNANFTTVQAMEEAEIKEASEEAQLIQKTAVERTVNETPELATPALENYQAQVTQSDEEFNSTLKYELANIHNTPGSEGLTQDERERIAVQDYMKNGFAKTLDEQGTAEFAGDFLNMALVPDESYNWSEIADGNWFTSSQGMDSLIEKRSQLTPKQQLLFDKELLSNLQGLESSEIQQFTTYLAAIGQDPTSSAYQYLEKAELITLFARVGVSITKGLRATNKARQLSKVGDQQTAAVVSDVVAGNKDLAKEVGMPQADAAIAGNPMKEQLGEVLNGQPVTESSVHRAFTTELEETLQEVDEISGLQPNLTPRDQREIASRFAKEWKADSINDAKIDFPTDKEALITMTKADGSTEELSYTLDDLGGFVDKEGSNVKTALSWVVSPKAKFGADRGDLVEAPVLGEMRSAKASTLYMQSVDLALKPVKGNKKSLQNISDVLAELDGKDVDTSRHALTKVGIGSLKLSDTEYDAWKGVRQIFDHAYAVNNRTMRREMQLRGTKHTSLNTDDYYVKDFDSVDLAKSRMLREEGPSFQVVMKGDSGQYEVKVMQGDALDDFYNKGFKLVEVESNDAYGWFKTSDGNHSKYAIISKSDVNEPPKKVLNKVPNYVPKERQDANFFIKQRRKMTVNGKEVDAWVTRAYASNKTQGQEWLSKVRNSSGKNFNQSDWEIKYDREVTASLDVDANEIRMTGGMYRGSRSSSSIKYAGDGTEGKRTNPLGALQRHLNYTADKMAMSEMRLVLKRRWYNDASLIDPNVTKLSWKEARGAIEGSAAGSNTKSRLLSQHSQISHVSRIPVESEQRWQGALRAVGEHFDDKGYQGIANHFYSDGSAIAKSPVARMKSGSFHLLLGAFNPAQFVVQFMGATVAAGANPLAFTKAFPKMLGTAMIDAAGSTRSQSLDMIKTLRKKGLVPEDAADDWKFWDRSGYRESVLRTNGDLDAAGNYAPLETGAVQRVFDKGLDLGTKPYQMGELANMRTSFYTALEVEKKRMGKGFAYTDATLQRVVSRAENYRLNMSNANKATYQKGIASLPTQFKSIYTKFAEVLLVGGKSDTAGFFTKGQRARIFTTQAALFGSMGVPIINHWADAVVNAFTDDTDSAETKGMVKRGAVGWLVNDYMDMDAAIAGRVAVAGDLASEFTNLFDSDIPFIKTAIGASFTTGDRAIDFVTNMYGAGRLAWHAEDVDVETVGMVAQQVATAVASLPTSSRRWMEAYYLQTMDKMVVNGKELWRYGEGEVGLEDVAARALGFSSQELEDVYATSMAQRDRKKVVRDKAQAYVQLLGSLMLHIEDQDEAAVKASHLAMSLVMGDVKNGKDNADFNRAVQQALQQQDFRGRTYAEWVQNYNSELMSATGNLFLPGAKKLEEDTK